MFSERTTLQRLLLLKALSSGQSLVERTALGNPLTFGTDVAKPLKSLLIPFTPIQSGTGDPSPENIRPILPWDGLDVGHCKKNMFNGIRENGYISDSGVIGSDGYSEHSQLIRVEAGKKYTYSIGTCASGNKMVHGYDILGNWVLMIQKNADTPSGSFHSTFTIPQGVYFIRVQFFNRDTDKDVQIEEGETVTAYEPYNGTVYHSTFPSPVYGGTLDVVSGVLTVLWKRVLLKGEPSGVSSTYQGSLFYNQNILSDADFEKEFVCNCLKYVGYTTTNFAYGTCINNGRSSFNLWVRETVFADKAEAETWLADNDTEICYQLKTPVEIQLTPAQITALIGDNTIWSDADGSMTCVYLVSSKYNEEHPLLGGGLGSGLGSGLLGSGMEDNPDDPIEDPEEEVPDNTEEGSESE